MYNRKYVIARYETGNDLYGMPWNSTDLEFVMGFMAPSDRVKGWDEGGMQDIVHEPRIRKKYTRSSLCATKFDEDDANFFSSFLNMIFRNSPYKFTSRKLF